MSVNIFTNGLLSKVAGNYTTDLQMSSTSNNPIANSVVKNYIDSKSSDSVLYYATEAEMDQDWENIPEGATISTPDGSEELTASSVSYDDGTSAGSDVQTEISGIKSDLSQMGAIDLLGYIIGGTGSATVNLPSGKKFSDYASVYVAFDLNGNHYAPTTIPLNAFTGHQTLISCYDTTQNVVGVLTPINDTQFAGESFVSGYTLVVYGVG